MTVKVLKSFSQIDTARKELADKGASCLSPRPLRFLQKMGLLKGISLGDRIKSWDILQTAEFILDSLPKDAPVLDIGAYASEILLVLNRLGYTNLTGVDLNPDIGSMPHADTIRYKISDFMQTPFADGSFAAITATSVIEHGFQRQRLLTEVSRLLRPGGLFIASFDYWPEKIDTSTIELFGMSWTIFSRDEVLRFLEEATRYGLESVGELDLDIAEPIIHWGGKDYTFAWMVLRKKG